MDIATYMLDVGRAARAASRLVAAASSATKAKALLAIADALDAERGALIEANQQDLEAAIGGGKTSKTQRNTLAG